MNFTFQILVFGFIHFVIKGFCCVIASEGVVDTSNNTTCPENELFDNGTQTCHLINTRGPCGELMRFVQLTEKSSFGTCECDTLDLDKNNCTHRPKIYWLRDKRCYYAFDQGPCHEGEWLTLEKTNSLYTPLCTHNPCLENQRKFYSDTENGFWFSFGGNCYQTGTQGFCRTPKFKVYIGRNGINPLCLADSECQNTTGENENNDQESFVLGGCNLQGPSSGNRKYVGNCRKNRKTNIQQ